MEKKEYSSHGSLSSSAGVMTLSKYLGDALSSVSTNIIFNISGMMAYFYTDIIGMAAGTVGTVLLLSKIVDAFTDIGMGVIVDRTKSKYGKARPWLLRMALPALICLILPFIIPTGAGEGVQFAYATATNFLMIAIVCTAITVPQGSLLSFETKSTHERSIMGIIRVVFAYIAGTAVSGWIVPLTNSLGGGQNAWIIMAAIFGAVSAITLIISFLTVRETNYVPPREEKKKSFPAKEMAHLFKNKYWCMALAVNVLIQVVYSVSSIGTYHAKYIFGNENLVGIIGIYRLIAAFAGFMLSGVLMRRFGKRNLIIMGMVLGIAGCLLCAVSPYNFDLNLIGLSIITLGGVPALATMGAMVADSIEYGEWKTGRRAVGIASSIYSFAAKLAAAIWAGAIGWLLGLAGYNGMLAVQPAMANQMIIIFNVYVPLVCYGIIFVTMFFYKLDKEYDGIMQDLELRRSHIEDVGAAMPTSTQPE